MSFPLFLAFFLSFVLAVSMLLTACFLTQRTDFSNGPFLHPPGLPLPCALISMPLLALPTTCPSPTHLSSRWLASLLGVWAGQISSFSLSCWKRMEIWIPCRVFSAHCLDASINLMAVNTVPGSAHRAGLLDNGDIYGMCIAYVMIAAKVVNKQMLSIKQWESRIIIFDRWMRMTGLKRLPHSLMQIAFPTAWISASMRRLKVWKWIGKSNSTVCSPPTVGEGCECVSSTDPTGQDMQEDSLFRCQEDSPEPHCKICTKQALPVGAGYGQDTAKHLSGPLRQICCSAGAPHIGGDLSGFKNALLQKLFWRVFHWGLQPESTPAGRVYTWFIQQVPQEDA